MNEMAWIRPPWHNGVREWDGWPYSYDGFLAAVPLSSGGYDFAYVVLQEHGGLDCNGDPWGWELDDVEWIARVTNPEESP